MGWPTFGTHFTYLDAAIGDPFPVALVAFAHGGEWCYAVERVLVLDCDARPTDEVVLDANLRRAFRGDPRACAAHFATATALPLRRRHDAPRGPRPLPLRVLDALLHAHQGIAVEHVDHEFHGACELAIARATARRAGVDPVACLALVRFF